MTPIHSTLTELTRRAFLGRSAGGLGSLGNIGGPEHGQNEFEATLGLAEHPDSHLKLEQGAILKSDGAWQVVAGWEYDFGEGN